MGYGDKFHFYDYESDDTNHYAIKLTELVAAQGGFTSIVSPKTSYTWSYGHGNLRHVTGVTTAGKRASIPIQSPSNDKYTSGGTFTLHSETYTILGSEGERQPASAAG